MNAVTLFTSTGNQNARLSIGLQTIYERHAEREAAMALCGISFVDCVRANLGRRRTEITVTRVGPRKGAEELRVRAEDVFEAWKAFLRADEQRATRLHNLTAFVGEFEALVSEFMTWLATSFTTRYRAVTDAQDRAWLESVARLALARRIMENKHRERFNGGFVDELAQGATHMLIIMRDGVLPNVARVTWHVGKTAQQHDGANLSDPLLDTINTMLFNVARTVMGENAQSLPPLPSHVAPFRLLPERVSAVTADEEVVQ